MREELAVVFCRGHVGQEFFMTGFQFVVFQVGCSQFFLHAGQIASFLIEGSKNNSCQFSLFLASAFAIFLASSFFFLNIIE